MASSVRRLCPDATLGRYWRIGLVVRGVWMDLRSGGISRIAEACESKSTAAVHRRPGRQRAPPSCNRDRAPDAGISADDIPETTQSVAFDFASASTGTLAFVEGAFSVSSVESRMLNCRLSEKHLNRRAARLVNLATRHDKTSASRSNHDVQESRVKYVPLPVSCKKYLCEL